ncbi:MAG: TIGR03936 family radical SAM-associated protein [Anaerolineales bacterium]
MKKQRIRIYFSKTDAMRFTGHLDLILTWERTFRRAGLPLSYSEGFSPRPVLTLAAPLPLGLISTGEIGDFWLSEIIPVAEIQAALQKALPPGLQINTILEIKDIFGFKLPSLVLAASYSITLNSRFPNLGKKVKDLLNTATLKRERKGKTYDLRPLVKSLTCTAGNNTGPDELLTTLVILPGATGRPDEIVAALGIPRDQARICRTSIILESEGDQT